MYCEIDCSLDFTKKVLEIKPDVIIYNWCSMTMKWLTPAITNSLNIKQLFTFHDGPEPSYFKNDGFIMTNLIEDKKNKKFSLPRPVFEIKLKKPINHKRDIPTIGSFGFGFKHKGFEKICKLVNSTFDKAIVHLHITNPFFTNAEEQNFVIQSCKNEITKKEIKLIVTNNFISNEGILHFLNKNTANIFLYDNLSNSQGLSSVLDYAISVDTPLIINNSKMFRHLWSDRPEISIENQSINEIINQGVDSVQYFRKKWSNDNMRDEFYKILQSLRRKNLL